MGKGWKKFKRDASRYMNDAQKMGFTLAAVKAKYRETPYAKGEVPWSPYYKAKGSSQHYTKGAFYNTNVGQASARLVNFIKLINKRNGRNTNMLTDEGTYHYFDTFTSLAIANLSGNSKETKSLRQLNATTLCPVPTASGQFFHEKTIYTLRFESNAVSGGRMAYITLFAIWPKGTWTPGEGTGSFEGLIANQNNSLFKYEVLAHFPIMPEFKTYSGANAMYFWNSMIQLDLTTLMNRLQSSINQREGLINEIDATPCYLGMCLHAADDGQTYYIDGTLVDKRGLKKVPLKV